VKLLARVWCLVFLTVYYYFRLLVSVSFDVWFFWHCPHNMCVSVRPILPPHATAAGLLLWAQQAEDSARLLPGAQQRHSTLHSSKCGQCHVVI